MGLMVFDYKPWQVEQMNYRLLFYIKKLKRIVLNIISFSWSFKEKQMLSQFIKELIPLEVLYRASHLLQKHISYIQQLFCKLIPQSTPIIKILRTIFENCFARSRSPNLWILHV